MKKREQDERAATPDEIHQALESLTKTELLRVDSYARFRFQALGRRRQGRDPDELVSDALLALFDGRRVWKPSKCNFFICLMGVIRSQSYHLRQDKPGDAFDDLESFGVGAEKDGDPLDQRPSSTVPDPLLVLEAEGTQRVAKERFKDDPEAALVLEALLDGQAPEEIRKGLDLSVQAYDTTVKRVRRAVRKMIKEGRA